MTRCAFSKLILSLLIGSVGCAANATNRPWREIKTGQFHVISSVSNEDTTQFVHNLRSFHQLVEQISGIKFPAPAVPTKVYVFDGRASLAAIRPPSRQNLVGVFSAGMRAHYSWFDADAHSPHRIAYHEYVHLLLQQSGVRYPWWYEEGLAEFLSTAVFLADKIKLGNPPPRGGLIKLKALAFGTDVGPPTGTRIVAESAEQEDDFLYTRAWALVDFILVGHLVGATDKRQSLATFLSQLASGQDDGSAFQAAFGMGLDDFVVGRLYAHVRRDRYPLVNVPRPSAQEGTVPAPRQLSKTDVLYELGQLHRHLGNHAIAVERFKSALQILPSHARAMVGLAVDLSRQEKYDEAQTLFVRALDIVTDDPGMHVDFGNHLAEQGKWQKAREHYRQATQLAPNHPEAWARLGASHSLADRLNETGLAEALAALDKANKLLPYSPFVYVHLGNLHGRAGHVAVSRRYLRTVAALRNSEDHTDTANDLLEALADTYGEEENAK